MNPIAALRRHFANVERSRQMLEEIREGIANLTDVTNRHLIKLAEIMEVAAKEAKRAETRGRSIPVNSQSMSIDAAQIRSPLPMSTHTSACNR